MKNIKPHVYDNLTPRQRIIATIEALARDDDAESMRLANTCPKRSYTQPDAAYADKMDCLIKMSLTIECDLRGSAIYFLHNLLVYNLCHQEYLQNIADIREAWAQMLDSLEINPESMKQASCPSNKVVDALEGVLPQPAPKNVKDVLERLNKIYSNN